MAHYRRTTKKVSKIRKELISKINFIIKIINDAKRIRVIDDENFESGMCNNGGHYRFYEDYYREDNVWSIYYHNSSEFITCSRCGDFDQDSHCIWNDDIQDWESICNIRTITTKELIRIVLNALQDKTECLYYPGNKAKYVEYFDQNDFNLSIIVDKEF